MSSLEEREKRSNSVAARMGELLLKGHKMLATSCELCNNVLLQDRDGNTFCVSCNEFRHEEGGVLNNRDEMDPTGPGVSGNVTGGQVYVSLLATKEFLLNEIQTSTAYLQHIGATADLQHKQTYIRHIRECAETIQALRNIST